MGDKVDNTIDKKEVDEASIEAVIAESASADSSDKKKAEIEKSSNAGTYFIALILLIAAIVGGLTLTGQLQPLYESLTNPTTTELAAVPEQAEPFVAQPGSLIEPSPYSQTQPTGAAIHPDMEDEPAGLDPDANAAVDAAPGTVHGGVKRPAGDAVNDLLYSIDSLRNALWRLEESQKILQHSLVEQQQMNLQVRLRWIADAESRLPQIQLAWEEISLLPGLNELQRQQAVDMHTLARANVQRLNQWQGSLQKWAEALTTPLHENVLPQPEHAWLAWIVGQFQLRQAPSQEARTLADLRGRLLDSARQLTLQSWPDQSAWQRLHAELLLQIKAMQAGDEKAAVETGLPVDFEGIQVDINTLRQTAQHWVSDVQHESMQLERVPQDNMQQGGML